MIFLDKTILPDEETGEISCEVVDMWKDNLSKNLDSSHELFISLETLLEKQTAKYFGIFLKYLKKFAVSEHRVWIIVDEVVEFSKFPITLPDEQTRTPFKWIVTGSAGIGSWVAKRHLTRYVFDLPLWSKNQCVEFATKLCLFLKRFKIEHII